jgi:outer membrane lipoprotein carrier protein
MRKISHFASAAAVAVAFATIPGAAARAQSADAVMDRAVAAYSHLSSMRAGFTQTLTNPLTGSTQTTSGVILRKKPNLLSIDFDSGDRVAADGSSLWVYLPSSTPGQVMRMPAKGASADAMDPAGEFLDSPRTRFTVASSGTATLGGRPTHAVTLVPKRANPNFTSAKVWIDDADSSIRQFDIETANGLKRHVVITSFTANPALSRASFRFVPPKGAKVIDQASGAF